MKNVLMLAVLSIVTLFVSAAHANTPNSTYRSGDLLALHWDAFPDYDDLQAMIATRELLDEVGNVRYLAVIGTTGDFANSVNILNGSLEHMSTMFDNVIDARRKAWSNTSKLAANQWEATLRAGGTVHVAEGGPSEFTARVINELKSRGVGGLKRIRVVQHSIPANQNSTRAANLNTVRSSATYVNIDDGNFLNGTSGFSGVVATLAARNSFKSRSLNSTYGSQWARAYSYVRPQTSPRVIDFSDFVEVMNIFGISKNEIPTITAFANRFFDSNNSPSQPTPSQPTTPSNPGERFAAIGNSLPQAEAAFAAGTNSSRVDCDRIPDGRWICANFANPSLSDVDDDSGPSTPAPSNPAPSNPGPSNPGPTSPTTPTQPPTSSGRFAAAGNTLAQAQAAYANGTDAPRVDCDRLSDGRWVCANFKNPTASDIGGTPAPSTPAPTTPANPTTPPSQPSTGKLAVVGANLSQAKANFKASSSTKIVDCDPVGDGRWICANFKNPKLSDL